MFIREFTKYGKLVGINYLKKFKYGDIANN